MKIGEVWTHIETGDKARITEIYTGIAEYDIFEEYGTHTWICLESYPFTDDINECWANVERVQFLRMFEKDYDASR